MHMTASQKLTNLTPRPSATADIRIDPLYCEKRRPAEFETRCTVIYLHTSCIDVYDYSHKLKAGANSPSGDS